MKKYLISKDWKASFKSGFEFTLIEASDIIEAMIKADKMWNSNIYMMHIFTKKGKTETPEKGIKAETFEAVLAKRSPSGWHPNTEAYSETTFRVQRCYSLCGEWYEVVN